MNWDIDIVMDIPLYIFSFPMSFRSLFSPRHSNVSNLVIFRGQWHTGLWWRHTHINCGLADRISQVRQHIGQRHILLRQVKMEHHIHSLYHNNTTCWIISFSRITLSLLIVNFIDMTTRIDTTQLLFLSSIQNDPLTIYYYFPLLCLCLFNHPPHLR